jgi:hypothetical protein
VQAPPTHHCLISASRGRTGQEACVTFQRPGDVMAPDPQEYTQPQPAATTGRQRWGAGELALADAVTCAGAGACTGVAPGVTMFVSGALDFAHPTPTIRQVPITIALRIEKA